MRAKFKVGTRVIVIDNVEFAGKLDIGEILVIEELSLVPMCKSTKDGRSVAVKQSRVRLVKERKCKQGRKYYIFNTSSRLFYKAEGCGTTESINEAVPVSKKVKKRYGKIPKWLVFIKVTE